MERSKRSEATLNTRMKHDDDNGINEDSNLSRLEPDSVRASCKEDSQRTTTLTDNKKRDYENEGSSMHEDSCIGINSAHMFPKCFRSFHTLLVSLCSGTLSSTKFSLNSCSHSQISELARPESANNGFLHSIMVSFLFVFGIFWLAWACS